MKKILWIYTTRSSFVEKDIILMMNYYHIYEFEFWYKSVFLAIYSTMRLFFKLIFNHYDLMVCQFAGYHSFIPAIFKKYFKKKLLIIAGGTDCTSFPQLNYGNFSKKTLGKITAFSFQNASYITPVDESLIFQEYTYDSSFTNQGIKYFIPDIQTPIKVIYNGYDANKWYCIAEKKPQTFLTVISSPNVSKLKGIDMIYEIADFFPDCTFTIIGMQKSQSSFSEKKNITMHHFIPHKQLIKYFSTSEFYIHLSLSEGFPNALCEAMLCECIPIVSGVASMPEIVGDAGFVLKKRDVNELKKLIKAALNSDKKTLAKKARQRIQENYTEERRKKELKALIDHIIG